MSLWFWGPYTQIPEQNSYADNSSSLLLVICKLPSKSEKYNFHNLRGDRLNITMNSCLVYYRYRWLRIEIFLDTCHRLHMFDMHVSINKYFLFRWLRGPKGNDTPVAMSTLSILLLVSNTIFQQKEPSSLVSLSFASTVICCFRQQQLWHLPANIFFSGLGTRQVPTQEK